MACQCPIMQDPDQAKSSCYRCGGAGHVAQVCPTPAQSQARVQKEVPRNMNPNYQKLLWRPRCRTSNHLIRNCPLLEQATAAWSQMQSMGALDCPTDVPGLVSSMITSQSQSMASRWLHVLTLEQQPMCAREKRPTRSRRMETLSLGKGRGICCL